MKTPGQLLFEAYVNIFGPWHQVINWTKLFGRTQKYWEKVAACYVEALSAGGEKQCAKPFVIGSFVLMLGVFAWVQVEMRGLHQRIEITKMTADVWEKVATDRKAQIARLEARCESK